MGTQIVVAIDDFGFDLLRHTIGSSGPNTVLSPYSVSSILALTAGGARGVTGTEMRQALHVGGMTEAATQEQWTQLNAEIARRSLDQKLKVANAGWVREGLRLQPDFVASARSVFGAQITTVDFATRNMATIVNSWVAAHTDGMIPQIIERVNPEAVLLLADAVYFKGTWQSPFRVGGTVDGNFTLPNGTTVKVPMMSRWDNSTQALETSSFLIVRLPYKGFDSAMYLLLPDENMGLANIEQTITGRQFLEVARATAKVAPRENTLLMLPRLDLSWGQQNMKDVLRAMGISSAFDSAAADLSGIADRKPLWIGQLAHKTIVKVGELGTEAAAATFELMGGGRPAMILFNRPFLFAIVDEKSGAILFLGAVDDPRAN